MNTPVPDLNIAAATPLLFVIEIDPLTFPLANPSGGGTHLYGANDPLGCRTSGVSISCSSLR